MLWNVFVFFKREKDHNVKACALCSHVSSQQSGHWGLGLRSSPLAERMLRSVWTCELASTSGKSSGMGQKGRCSPLHLHSENALHCSRCPCVRCQAFYLLMEGTWEKQCFGHKSPKHNASSLHTFQCGKERDPPFAIIHPDPAASNRLWAAEWILVQTCTIEHKKQRIRDYECPTLHCFDTNRAVQMLKGTQSLY